VTGERISGSSLIARKAQPTDPLIDSFNFGPDDWSREVEDEFKSRIWFKSKSPLFLFLRDSADQDGEELVAGARFGYGNLPDPATGDADETERAHFHLVMSFGVQVTCQHRDDPLTSPPRRWASVVMDHAESKARAKDRCVGMSLWVREENTDAQKFYRNRHGFEIVRGPFEAVREPAALDRDPPEEARMASYFEMRKRFEGR
jgi:hypothetical protein